MRDKKEKNNKATDCRTSVFYDLWEQKFYNTTLFIIFASLLKSKRQKK